MPCLAPGTMTDIKLAAGKSGSPGAIPIARWRVCRPGCPGLLPRRFEPGSRVGPVAERLVGGAAAAAQSKRMLGNRVGGAVPPSHCGLGRDRARSEAL